MRLNKHEKWKVMGNCDRNDSFFLEIPHHLSSTEWYFCQSLCLFWSDVAKIKLKICSRFNQNWRNFCSYFLCQRLTCTPNEIYLFFWELFSTYFLFPIFLCEINSGNILSAFLKVTAWHRIQITLVMHTHSKSDMEDECETNRKSISSWNNNLAVNTSFICKMNVCAFYEVPTVNVIDLQPILPVYGTTFLS